ncbi:hypothetical protein FIV04_11775 [Vibrio sp. THAF190c]|nr:hypothetical protein FIV04_11775 [Vibrio sp. THAF190c]|tara:strand:+ start:2339 stop:2596 length:258 start_codon:yes stop_codon:yes gene_type:complete
MATPYGRVRIPFVFLILEYRKSITTKNPPNNKVTIKKYSIDLIEIAQDSAMINLESPAPKIPNLHSNIDTIEAMITLYSLKPLLK